MCYSCLLPNFTTESISRDYFTLKDNVNVKDTFGLLIERRSSIYIKQVTRISSSSRGEQEFPEIQASNFPSLPVAFSNSRSLPKKRECDFKFPFPFPGPKKPFPLTPGLI